MRDLRLVISGNIGVGKSSFVDLYARASGLPAVQEAVAENPFLADFYADRKRWGFHSQIFFLGTRLAQEATLAAQSSFIQDRSLYEDAEVFAANLFGEGSLSERDWRTYRLLYDAALATLRPPSLVVYLRASVPTLKSRIAKRGRDYELKIPDAYLARLNELYDAWAGGFRAARLVTIDVDALDFVGDQAAFAAIRAKIDACASS